MSVKSVENNCVEKKLLKSLYVQVLIAVTLDFQNNDEEN